MCCESFWKRVVVFCLAFGFGVLVSDAFFSKETSSESQKTVNISVSIEKNCVPVDSSLKYENLAVKEKPDSAPLNETPKLEIKKDADKKSLKEDQAKQKPTAEPNGQFYVPSKDSAEYKILLHREKCFETDGRK